MGVGNESARLESCLLHLIPWAYILLGFVVFLLEGLERWELGRAGEMEVVFV